MKIQILNNAKKKKILKEISYLGLSKIPQALIKTGSERLRAFSGSLDTEKIYALWRILPIEGVGLYIGKDSTNRSGVREVRLSLDGLHVYKDQINSNIITLSSEQEIEWFKGKNLELSEEQIVEFKDLGKEFVAVRSSDEKDFVGTAKIGGSKHDTLFGFLPKERRRKSQVI
jgi:NOL1/NOP2/fmu family ribosome biogenesis protein